MRFPKTALPCMLAFAAAVATAQDVNPALPPAPAPAPAFTDEQAIEAFGWFLAHQSGLVALGFNAEEIVTLGRGMAQAVAGEDSPYDFEKIGPTIQELISKRRTTAMDKLRVQGLQETETFMAEIRAKPGVVPLDNGLAYEIVSEGTGPKPRADQVVTVNYVGRLINGTIFDRSEEGTPTELALDAVIPGWTEGLVHVNQGSKIILYVPPDLAYGDSGSQEIPPSSTLIFDIDLLDVKDAPAEAAADADEPAATEATATGTND